MNEEAQKKTIIDEAQKKTNEEAQKRHTDCVYFLASPLTCKKGNECEYRHSESARVNPRDCWYWLNGNCLNPACAFRHPPLDGLSGAPSLVSSQPPAALSLAASSNANKPRGPCFFFNQGFCSKGDKCPFMHGTYSGGNLTTQKAAKANTAVIEPQASGKQAANEAENIKNGKLSSSPSVPSAWLSNDPKTMQSTNLMSGINNFKGIKFSNLTTMESNNLKALQQGNPVGVHLNHAEAVHLVPEAKPVTHVRSQPVSTKVKRHNIESDLPEMESTRQRVADASSTRSRLRNAQPPDDRLQNGMESEEWLGESSPGFDVLVDNGPDQPNHPEDADYHSNHDIELGRGATNGRERNRKREFGRYEYDQTSMHDRTGYSDAEFQYDQGAYDPYRQRGYDNMGRKQHKHLDDWAKERPIVRERRSLSIENDSEQNCIEDLRHHISKRKRIGGAKAVENSKRQHVDSQHGDFHHGHRIRDDEHRYHDVTYKDQSQHGNSRRLQGRIQIEAGGFKRESFDSADSDYEGRSERFRSRSSPGRRCVSDNPRSTYRGKERNRMLPDSSASSDIRGSRGQNFKDNESRTDTMDFAAPKTLAQIKQEKLGRNEEHASSVQSRMLGSFQSGSVKSETKLRQNLPLEETKVRLGRGTRELSEEAAFEGPKPLSDILKAKRQAGEGSDDTTGNRSANIPYQSYDRFNLDMNTNSAEMLKFSTDPEKEVEEGELHEGDDYAHDMSTVGQAVDVEPSGLDAVAEHNPATLANGTVASQTKDQEDTLMNETVHRNEGENLDIDHEEYDLEPAETEENESWLRNADQMQEDEEDEEDNYIEDDDDDDFAKKLGGIFS